MGRFFLAVKNILTGNHSKHTYDTYLPTATIPTYDTYLQLPPFRSARFPLSTYLYNHNTLYQENGVGVIASGQKQHEQ